MSFKYCLQCDFYAGSDVPSDLGKMHIEIACGRYSIRSEPTKVHEGMLAHYAPLPELTMFFPTGPEFVPDIFVYLIDGAGNRVCFLRFGFKAVADLDFKVPPKWFCLRECQALDKIQPPNSPGNLQVRIFLRSHYLYFI